MAATAKTQLHLKLSSFYGAAVPRPYVLLDKETGETVQDRVDAPQVNDALIGAHVALLVYMPQQGRGPAGSAGFDGGGKRGVS